MFQKLKLLAPSPVNVRLRRTKVMKVLYSFSTVTSKKDSLLWDSISLEISGSWKKKIQDVLVIAEKHKRVIHVPLLSYQSEIRGTVAQSNCLMKAQKPIR